MVKSNMDRTQLGGCCNVKEARGSLLKTHPLIQTPHHLESTYNTPDNPENEASIKYSSNKSTNVGN